MMRRTLRGGVLVGCLMGFGVLPAVAHAAPIMVTSNLATGAGSLADAINQANSTPATDTIAFSLPGGNRVISISGDGLPVVTSPVIMDGRTQPGYAGAPIVQLVGCKITHDPCVPEGESGGDSAGVRLAPGAAGSQVSGLSVARFNQGGIVVEAPNSTISGNYVGVNLGGSGLGVGNGKGGVVVRASNVTVGGTSAAEANVIDDNHEFCGVDVQSGTGSLIRGNLIGTDSTGNAGLANRSLPPETPSCGVRVEGSAAQTVIGGGSVSRNVISGNDVNGVEIRGGTDTFVQGNFIGLGADGDTVVANIGSGVFVSGGTGTVIGGTSATARNVISGNQADGVEVVGGTVSVQGNFIGVGPGGHVSKSNRDGVAVTGGTVTIGGTISGAGNLISGNTLTGITLGSGSYATAVLGNQVGGGGGATLGEAGNNTAQIRVTGSAAGNQLGSLVAGNRVIDVSGTGGIVLDGSGTGNTVRGNVVTLNGTMHPAIERTLVGNAGAPLLTKVYTSDARSQVIGTLSGAPLTRYALDVYADASCDSNDHGGIDRFFGSGIVTTDASGQATISVPIDNVPAVGERLLATVTDPVGTTSELGTCTTSTSTAPVLQLSTDVYSGKENEGVVRVTVVRAEGGPGSARVEIGVVPGTARPGVDYTDGNRFVAINADQTAASVDIPIHDDGRQAGNRTFEIVAHDPTAAVLGVRDRALATIVDDTPDPKPPPTTPTTPKPPPTTPTTPKPPPVVVSPATVTITSPHGTVRRVKVTSVRGKSTSTRGAKVRRVQVAVTRTARCERLASSGRLIRVKASLRKTCPPKWLTTKGTTSWKLVLRRRLPSGTYRISARADDVNGHVGRIRSVTVKLR